MEKLVRLFTNRFARPCRDSFFVASRFSLSLSLRVSFFSHDSSLTFQKLSSSIRSKENSDAFRAESCKRLLLLISAFFEFSKIEKKKKRNEKTLLRTG